MTWNELPSRIKLSGNPTLYQCESGWSWVNPRFVDFDLWIVLEGEGRLETGGAEFGVFRGDAMLFRPGDSVKARHDPARPLKVFAVHFTLPPAVKRAFCREVPRRLVFHDAARCEWMVMNILEEARSGKELCGLHLALLLAQGARDIQRRVSDAVTEKLKRLCVEIASNPARDWKPGAMAGKAGLSLPQFNRRFRNLTGTSPARYLIQRRVDRARLLLWETPMSLQEIAGALGYRDVYYFHRQFRAETGRTPSAFRKNPGRNPV